jgi:type III protein arginine methyltransferase
MSDWTRDLQEALATGDPAFMKAMLARVPDTVLRQARPYLQQLANSHTREGRFSDAVDCFDHMLRASSEDLDAHRGRAQALIQLARYDDALKAAEQLTRLAGQDAQAHRLRGEAHEGLGEREQALSAYKEALQLTPGDAQLLQRRQSLEAELRKAELLRQTLDPRAAAQAPGSAGTPPDVTFDPALLEDPALPPNADARQLGLIQHLRRYSNHQAVRNALDRLEDPAWLEIWDQALRVTAGKKVLFRGSELGTLALRALKHGARLVHVVEAQPLVARISAGIVQKHKLAAWQAAHGAQISGWTEDDQRRSFDAFAADIEVVPPDSEILQDADYDCFVFPDLDHSLLGTGLGRALKNCAAGKMKPGATLLPAKARLFAQGIQWLYPASEFDLQPVNELRWSLAPQPLELPADCWRPLTAAVALGEIDFRDVREGGWPARLPVTQSGELNAIVFWYELDLGGALLRNAPEAARGCIKPAVQYTDPQPLQAGAELELDVHLTDSRLQLRTRPAATQTRSRLLPSWYVPMLVDGARNSGYDQALRGKLADRPASRVLDIGAGFGLLSLMAARHPGHQVHACEATSAIARTAAEVVRINGAADRVHLLTKDCRALKVPDDLPERADLAVFELFDCSLIGEGVLHLLAYAREHLLKSDAAYLPRAAVVRGMVIEHRLERIWDIDVNILNPYRYSPSFINVDARRLAYRPLSRPFDVFRFDFANATPAPEEKDIRPPATDAGTAGALLFWFDLELDENTRLSNAPDSPSPMHWKQALQWLPEIRVERNFELPLLARHDGSGTTFRWRPDGVAREAVSKLPRFDPRAAQQVTELQMQTRSILQHCAGDPDEYRAVADIAQRLAIDPAAYDIDPKVALRLAATFLGT